MDYITTRDPANYTEYDADELPPREHKRTQLYRTLKYWRDDLLSCERALTDEDHAPYHQEYRRRIAEARGEIARLSLEIDKAALKEEWKTLQKTWMLQHQGLDAITARQSEIEAQLTNLEESQEVLNVA